MVGQNTEGTIDRLLDVLKSEPDFQEQLRRNFNQAIQAAGVPALSDVARSFLTGSSIDCAEDSTCSPNEQLTTNHIGPCALTYMGDGSHTRDLAFTHRL